VGIVDVMDVDARTGDLIVPPDFVEQVKARARVKKILQTIRQNAELQAGIRKACEWKFLVQLCDAIKMATEITDSKHLEYLVEETYLSYKGGGCSLEERVISFIKAVAKGKFDVTASDKKVALDKMIGKIKRSGRRLSRARRQLTHRIGIRSDIFDLMEGDKKRNLDRVQRGIHYYETFQDYRVVFCDGIVFLPAHGTLYVVGDTHGDTKTTRRLVDYFRESLKGQDDVYVVFLGDYVNNGLNSIDTLVSVLTLKKDFPENVVLLSGNHEFRETYFTAIREYFKVHWENAASHPSKSPPSHYDHIRLELAKKFGVEAGEAIYSLFAEWGRSLPYIAYSAKGVMMSHSIGLPSEYVGKGSTRTLNLQALAQAKRGKDERELERLGYEAWKKEKNTLHSCMVNTRDVKPDTLEKFKGLGANVFVVGHSHYRSGDIHKQGKMIAADIGGEGILVTLCSSVPDSPDAGHYIGHQFGCRRNCEQREGRSGLARACILKFKEGSADSIVKGNLIDVSEL
jgi:hypothetical protein